MSDRLWYWLGGVAILPALWLWHGPHVLRRFSAWYLSWWGWAFYYSKPWRPGSLVEVEPIPIEGDTR